MFRARHISTIAAAAAAGLIASAGHAGTATGAVGVTANVEHHCAVSTNPVAFGSINALSLSNADAAGAITVTCTRGTTWTASANAGTGLGASLGLRKMSSGPGLLLYNLYTDPSRTIVWGDGTGGTGLLGETGTGSPQASPIYGRVPPGQALAPEGSYADTVTVTLSY